MFYYNSLGKKVSGLRWEKVTNSKHFSDGCFKNIHGNQINKDGLSSLKVATEFLLHKNPPDIKPAAPMPSKKTNLTSLNDKLPVLIWFGHSSYLIKYNGLNILVDPVLDGYASPSPLLVKAFTGTDIYTPKEFPELDLVLITHDHYDHLDYQTILKLGPKIKKLLCPIGVGEHLESWGYPKENLIELDWWESHSLFSDIKITATPTRHFSGRSIQRFQTLWASYVLELRSHRIFLGGDSGYDDQFKKIGEKFGAFDLAILENGQYGENWPYIHMFPEETAQAAVDLNSKFLFPVHWGKFILSQHGWKDPIEKLVTKSAALNLQIKTPLIGEPFYLNNDVHKQWWTEIK